MKKLKYSQMQGATTQVAGKWLDMGEWGMVPIWELQRG